MAAPERVLISHAFGFNAMSPHRSSTSLKRMDQATCSSLLPLLFSYRGCCPTTDASGGGGSTSTTHPRPCHVPTANPASLLFSSRVGHLNKLAKGKRQPSSDGAPKRRPSGSAIAQSGPPVAGAFPLPSIHPGSWRTFRFGSFAFGRKGFGFVPARSPSRAVGPHSLPAAARFRLPQAPPLRGRLTCTARVPLRAA